MEQITKNVRKKSIKRKKITCFLPLQMFICTNKREHKSKLRSFLSVNVFKKKKCLQQKKKPVNETKKPKKNSSFSLHIIICIRFWKQIHKRNRTMNNKQKKRCFLLTHYVPFRFHKFYLYARWLREKNVQHRKWRSNFKYSFFPVVNRSKTKCYPSTIGNNSTKAKRKKEIDVKHILQSRM